MAEHHEPDGWIGRSMLRKEDARFLAGAGLFVADIRLPGLQDIAFVRSPVAHGTLRGIAKPADARRARFRPRRSRRRSTSSKPARS